MSTLSSQTFALQATTPTPAPSKTATPIASVTSIEATAEVTVTPEPITNGAAGIQPLTQDDMNVLTGNVQRPNGIVWFDNQLYTSCTGDWTLYSIDSTTGATLTYIFGVRNVHSLYAETDEAGELVLWTPDFDRNTLVRVMRTGLVEVASELNGPWGIAPLGTDGFLITNLLGNSIVYVNRSGATNEFLTDLRSPTGIAVDGEFVYVANNGSARRGIEWTTAIEATNTGTELQPLVSGIQNTTGVVLASDGYLYFAYSLGTRGIVGRVDPMVCRENGGCTNDQIEIVVYSELAAPIAGLAISPDMRLFMHTIYRPEIYWVQLDQ